MNNINKIKIILLFGLFLILLINLKFQFLNEEWTLLLYLIPMILFYFLRIDSRFFIIFAIIFLIYSAITLALVNNENYANLIAINAYYGLVVGVILQLVEHIKKREDLFYVKELSGVLFSIKLPKTKPLPEYRSKKINFSGIKNSKLFYFLTSNIKPILVMTLVFAIFEIITSYLYLTKQTAFTNYDTLWFLSSILFFPFVLLSVISIVLKRKR